MSAIRSILEQAGIQPRKQLGQNFLTQKKTAEKIVRWADVSERARVLEIGPGLGMLTHALQHANLNVTAIEFDRKLHKHLTAEFASSPSPRFICGDARTLDLTSLTPRETSRWHIISNLPYSLSTPILETLLNQLSSIAQMVLLLQEDVVNRIAAQVNTRDYGRLSIWVQSQCKVQRGPRISRGNFHPVPDVESRLVRLTPLPRPHVPSVEIDRFQQVVAVLFQHRRKTVRNALRDAHRPDWKVDEALEAAPIDPSRRPETLTIEELRTLARTLST